VRFVVAWAGLGLVLCGISFACAPSASTPATPPTADAFAVVRATSQAEYQAGATALAQGNYLQACVDLDAAKTNDPDNRPEIQQALNQALTRCLTPPPTSTVAAAVVQQTLVLATVPAAAAPTVGAQPTIAATTQAESTPTEAEAANAAGAEELVSWNDPQGRFSISAPSDWSRLDRPQSMFGTGVVAFRDPSGRAEADVAVDTSTKAVSPELYSASMELAMQKQVPGYASEQVLPGTTAGNPSVRRVFTFTQKDAAGQDHKARGFQVTLVKGSTPYIISGSAPAEQYQQYSSTFDQIVESFRFI
jgi:hypothetical protein